MPMMTVALTSAMLVAQPAAEARKLNFEIPAQDAAGALNAWSRRTGIQLLFPYRAVAGRRTAALRGMFTPREALDRLIEGQPLTIASQTSSTIALREVAAEPAGDAAPSRGTDDEEVVVTAQRRRERGQDVPISVSTFNARAVRDYRLQSLRDVSRLTPGLLVSNFSLASPIISVRGASNTFNQIGANKPVGVVVDDVFIPRNSAATFELFGIDSIQVLRGPQGTLFGRNVTGGAIVIDTGRPSFDAAALRLNAELGSYNTVNIDALADLPVAPNTAVRLAGAVRRRDGWGRDRLTGQELDDLQSENLRGQLRTLLTDSVELLLSGDYASDRSGGRTLSSIGPGDDGDRRTAETGVPQGFDREVGGVSGRLFWDTGVGEVTSITAWRRSRSADIYSNVGANFRFLAANQSQALTDDRDRVTTFSQEVRFASKAWSQGNLVVGAYFAHEDATRLLRSSALAGVTGALATNQLSDQAVTSDTYALFADGTLNLMSGLSVTLGGRYTWDRKEASLNRSDFIRPVNNFSARDLKASWERFTPRAVLNLRPLDDVLVYASFARGYTAGGFNTEAATIAALTRPFAPETLDNLEFGIKSEWLDRRLRVNIASFRMKYRDKQELFFNNVTRILNITNAARATMRGVEVEVQYRPVEWLGLTGNYGYLNTRYDDFVIPGGAVNTGNRLGSSPEHKASGILDINVPIGPVRLIGNAVYSYTSGYFTGASADPGLFVPGYSLVNGQIGIAGDNDRWRVAIFARNLLNKDYLLIPSVQVVRAQYLGEPRTIGVTAGVRF